MIKVLVFICDSATVVSISSFAILNASNHCFRFTLDLVIQVRFGNAPNTKTDDNNPFGPIVSLVDFIVILNNILSCII